MQDKIFDAMSKEALFTGEMLCAGYTQIRKANYASRGVYFQAFTSLSTGLERICKICYLLIYAIENDGQFPTNEYLKKTIGHDIGKLYGEIIRFKKAHAIQYDFLQDLDEPIYQKMLEVLSRFGKGDRYANIDFLTGSISYEDPISVWYRDVDMVIFKEKVSNKKKEKLWKNAYLIHQLARDFLTISYTSEDGKEINEAFDASFRTGLNEAVAPYRQLYVFHIIRFFVESLEAIEGIFRGQQFYEIPDFGDIFRVFYNDDSYMRGRKTIELV